MGAGRYRGLLGRVAGPSDYSVEAMGGVTTDMPTAYHIREAAERLITHHKELEASAVAAAVGISGRARVSKPYCIWYWF